MEKYKMHRKNNKYKFYSPQKQEKNALPKKVWKEKKNK